MPKMTPAQALPLLEQAVRNGRTFLASPQQVSSSALAWISHVLHILSDVEGINEAVLRELAEEADHPKHYMMAQLDPDRYTGSFAEWQQSSLATAINITATQVLILRAKLTSTVVTTPAPTGKKVFIGHGRSAAWMELQRFVESRLGLTVEEFNSVSTPGTTVIDRLKKMLDSVGFAFLIMTAEDEIGDGSIRARQNVIHEIGLFQGRLGFEKAIILLEEGCAEFSNVSGLIYIAFPKGRIKAAFEEVRTTLEHHGLVKPIAP